MSQPQRIQKTALAITRWIGSPSSIVVHTLLFIASFVAVLLGLIAWNEMLLVVTTIVSLEAIYLSIFIQLTINYTTEAVADISEDVEEMQEDVGEIQEDIDELQEDVEEMSEEESDDEQRKTEQKQTLATIQNDLRKLMSDIEKLQQRQ